MSRSGMVARHHASQPMTIKAGWCSQGREMKRLLNKHREKYQTLLFLRVDRTKVNCKCVTHADITAETQL